MRMKDKHYMTKVFQFSAYYIGNNLSVKHKQIYKNAHQYNTIHKLILQHMENFDNENPFLNITCQQ